ncbi:MAG: methyltransferase domain-containing protein [Desulfobacteraceae bacterium]|nr:methyltransferase domain-containing protein [Desulfobacteraceae bacterium]
MTAQLSQKDKNKIEAGINDKYAKVADSPQGQFNYPTGRSGLNALNYDSRLLGELPESLKASYCGVGNPFSVAPISKGEAVLDIGCGAGVDTMIAALITGPSGKSVVVDIVDKMLQRAETNLKLMGLENVAFYKASGEDLPFKNNKFDAVISNGAINLIPDKHAAIQEIFRILKPGGRLMIADQVLIDQLPENLKDRIDRWFQ